MYFTWAVFMYFTWAIFMYFTWAVFMLYFTWAVFMLYFTWAVFMLYFTWAVFCIPKVLFFSPLPHPSTHPLLCIVCSFCWCMRSLASSWPQLNYVSFPLSFHRVTWAYVNEALVILACVFFYFILFYFILLC